MTIVELKDLIQDSYETLDIYLNHDLNTARVIFDTDGMGLDFHTLDIKIVGRTEERSKQGVHTFIEGAGDDYHVENAIESALKDSFNTVYIHLMKGA